MRRIIRETEPPKPSTKLSSKAASGKQKGERDRAFLRRLLQEVRGDLDWIVMKCLEKDRQRRYETANGLAHDIERHLNNEPVEAAAPGMVYRLNKFIRRHRYGFATATAIILLLIAGVVVSTWQAVRATKAEEQAHLAKNQESEQRQRAEHSASESRQRLARLVLSQGNRAQGEGDGLTALLSFAEAWKLEAANPEAEEMHRFRVGYAFSRVPRLLQMWFHARLVSHLEFSPNGRWILTASGMHAQIRIPSLGILWVILCLTLAGMATETLFTADGQRVALLADERTVQFYEAATGRVLSAPLKHEFPVRHAKVSPDGRRLFTTVWIPEAGRTNSFSPGNEVCIWDVSVGREICARLRAVKAVLTTWSSARMDVGWQSIGPHGLVTAWDLANPRVLQFCGGDSDEARVIVGVKRFLAKVVSPSRHCCHRSRASPWKVYTKFADLPLRLNSPRMERRPSSRAGTERFEFGPCLPARGSRKFKRELHSRRGPVSG